MACLGDPHYEQGCIIEPKNVKAAKDFDLIHSYMAIECKFEFPEETEYPSIPCFIDETTTIYPLKGEAILTGAEYVLARKQNCEMEIKSAYRIPFKTGGIYPFKDIIIELQSKRREYSKGSFGNKLYKDMGNGGYGLLVQGMSDKRKFDIASKKTIRLEAGELSNPVMASYVTGFIRSIIGECLHSISKVGGRVVSVTTDGFITDIVDLEEKLKDNVLYQEFSKLRILLSNNPTVLELKNESKGVMA